MKAVVCLYVSGAVNMMLDRFGRKGLDFGYLPSETEGCTRWLLILGSRRAKSQHRDFLQ